MQTRRRKVCALGFREEIEEFEHVGVAVPARLAFCARLEEACGAYVALADERRDETARTRDAARLCFDDDARKSRVERQTQHLRAAFCHAPRFVNRAESIEQFICGRNRCGV